MKLDEREKQERRNNIIIRWMEKEEKNLREMIKTFLEKDFKLTVGVEEINILGGGGKEIALVKLKDWEEKSKLMKEKGKLGRRKIFIDHDLTKEEREVQRIIREKAGKEKRREKSKNRI